MMRNRISSSGLRQDSNSSLRGRNGFEFNQELTPAVRVSDNSGIETLCACTGAACIRSPNDLSNITSLAGAQEFSTYLFVEAEEGGQIDLSGVTEITGTSQGSGSRRGIQILADGTNSQVDLSSLISFTNSAPNPDSRLATVDGGTILADNLTIIEGVEVDLQ